MADTTSDPFAGAFQEASERSQQAMERGARVIQEFGDLANGNAAALAVSSRVAAVGLQKLAQEASDYGRRNLEEASAAFKSFTTVKAPSDLFKLQGDNARSAFGNFLTLSTRFTDSLVELGGQVAEPITDRFVAAAERVKTALEQ